MANSIKIDIISDISCGWCAVGLHAVEEALRNIGPEIAAELHFQPFELNPDMPAGGENLRDHLTYKYGSGGASQYLTATKSQGAQLGFEFGFNQDSRIYNTFDAHRLLHWAGLKGGQTALSHALFEAHFTRNQDPGDHDVLLACVEAAGLDRAEAKAVLNTAAYVDEVRALETRVHRMGIQAVPTMIINDRYVISGSRSPATFEQAIRKVLEAAEQVPPASQSSLTEGAGR